jgi:hypothetical protein
MAGISLRDVPCSLRYAVFCLTQKEGEELKKEGLVKAKVQKHLISNF